jgi:hypothetical protein
MESFTSKNYKKPNKDTIAFGRRRAVAIVEEILYFQDENGFTEFDFFLDSFVRQHYRLPAKELGKAPYDFVNIQAINR